MPAVHQSLFFYSPRSGSGDVVTHFISLFLSLHLLVPKIILRRVDLLVVMVGSCLSSDGALVSSCRSADGGLIHWNVRLMAAGNLFRGRSSHRQLAMKLADGLAAMTGRYGPAVLWVDNGAVPPRTPAITVQNSTIATASRDSIVLTRPVRQGVLWWRWRSRAKVRVLVRDETKVPTRARPVRMRLRYCASFLRTRCQNFVRYSAEYVILRVLRRC